MAEPIGIGNLILLPFIALMLLSSCNDPAEHARSAAGVPSIEDSARNYNRQIVNKELQEIDDYLLRYHWEMKKTQTGLRYLIYKEGSGPAPHPGSKVGIRYRVNLLTGDQVYETGHSAIFSFELGKRDVISGLEEGVMLMNRGSRAKLIVPSHLAFGLLGDQEKIPARAVLVYDVELIEINN